MRLAKREAQAAPHSYQICIKSVPVKPPQRAINGGQDCIAVRIFRKTINFSTTCLTIRLCLLKFSS